MQTSTPTIDLQYEYNSTIIYSAYYVSADTSHRETLADHECVNYNRY